MLQITSRFWSFEQSLHLRWPIMSHYFIYLRGYRGHFVKVQVNDFTKGASSTQVSEFLMQLLAQMSEPVEFPRKSRHRVKGYPACSYSAGETYPRDECRRLG